jgi:valyl-tRNA synthetase
MIHPIMPFITEELWQNMAERKSGETIMNQRYPQAKPYDAGLITAFEMACEAVAGVRNVRQSKNLSPREALELKIKGDFPEVALPVIVKLANVTIGKADGDLSTAQRFMVRTAEMFIPMSGLINVEEEIAKLEADLAYQQKFLDSVRKKLSNERFVANAPEAVVAVERKKEADSLSKIESITISLNALKNSK